MSTTVDQRVVEMRFDNRQFESGVSRTMDSIRSLKEKLNFTGATKGLESISAAVDDCDMSGLNGAIQTVQARFSAMEVIGVTALFNIANAAIHAGEKIISALTIDPIRTGFEEYETQINAVQTILANTQSKGTTLTDVNKALDELNRYADMTIYNFTEMTRNIGTFTAAGVDLKTSVSAIKGIANLAAISGSNSQQASTAMYQLSQALAAGTVKLQDWNSVVNAGMGGQVFQDALIETARVHGVAIDSMIEKEGSFRETLTNGWLTSELLTETLSKFTGDLNEEQLKTMGYTEEQIASIIKMGKTANDAATKVKTFSQLFDTLKEAAQSGWTQSWEIIVGDFEEAKDLLTEASDRFSEIINKSAEARNTLLSGGLSSGWKQFLDKGIDDETGYIEVVKSVTREHNISIDDMIEKSGSFQSTLKEEWLSADILAESITKYSDRLENMSENELEASGYTKEQVERMKALKIAVDNGSVSVDDFAEKIARPSGRENLIEALWNSFNGILSVISPVKEAFREIFPAMTAEQLYAITVKIHDFTEKLKLSETASENLKATFKGIFALIDTGKNLFVSLVEAVLPVTSSLDDISGGLLGLSASFGNLLTKVSETINSSSVISKTFDTISDITGSFAKNTEKSVEQIRDSLSKMADIIGGIGSSISQSISTLFSSIDFGNILSLVNGGIFASILYGIKQFSTKFFDDISSVTKQGRSLIGGITDILDGVKGSLEAWQTSIKAEALLKIAIALGLLSASIVALSTVDAEQLGSSLMALSVMFIELFGAMQLFSGVMSVKGLLAMTKISVGMIALSTAVLILSAAVKNLSSLNWDELARGLSGVAGLVAILVISASQLSKTSAKLITGSIGLIAFGGALMILAQVTKQFQSMEPGNIAKGLIAIGVLCGELMVFLNMTNFDKLGIRTGIGLIAVSTSIMILAEAVNKFVLLNPEEIAKGLIAVGVLLLEIASFARMVGDNKKLLSTAIGLTVLSVAVSSFGKTVSMLGTIPIGSLVQGISSIAAMLTIFAVALRGMTGTLGGSAAMLVAAAAVAVLTPSLIMLSGLSLSGIVTGLIALAGAFTVIGIAGALLTPILPSILGLAAAMALIGIGVASLGTGLIAIGAGLTAIAVGFSSVVAMGDSVIGGAIDLVLTFINTITSRLPEVINAGMNLMVNFLNGLSDALRDNSYILGEAIGNIVTALLESAADIILGFGTVFNEHGVTIVSKMIDGIGSMVGGLRSVAKEILTRFLEAAKAEVAKAKQIGIDAVSGIVNGIRSKIQDIVNAAKNIGNNILNTVRNVLDSHSPSRKMHEIGGDAVQGSIEGIKEKGSDLRKSVTDTMVNGVLKPTQEITQQTAEEFSCASGVMDSFGKEYANLVVLMDDTSGIDAATMSIEEYTRSLYEESSQYEKDTEQIEKHKKELSELEQKRDDLQKQLEDNSENRKKLTSKEVKKIQSDLDKVEESIKKKNEEIKEDEDEMVKHTQEAYEKMRDSIKSSLKDATDPLKQSVDSQIKLFEKFDTESEITTEEILENMKSQIDGVAQWRNDLEKLSAKGVSAGLLNELKEMGPSGAKYVKAFMEMSTSELNTANTAFAQSSKITSETLLSNFQNALTTTKEWVTNIQLLSQSGLDSAIVQALGEMGTASAEYVNAFLSMAPEEIASFNSMYAESLTLSDEAANSLMQSFSGAATEITSKLTTELNKSLGPQSENAALLSESTMMVGETASTGVATGIENKKEDLKQKVTSVASDALDGFKEHLNRDNGKKIGKEVDDGLIVGIENGRSGVITAAVNTAVAAYNAAKEALDIESPSKKFAELGLAKGMEAYAYKVAEAGANAGTVAIDGLKDSISRISDIVNGDVDITPRIRPVIDLSNVESGVSRMDRLFEANRSIQLAAETQSSIDAAAERRYNVKTSQQQGDSQPRSIVFEQNNYSPKALSRIEIYRQTKNQFAAAKGVLSEL